MSLSNDPLEVSLAHDARLICSVRRSSRAAIGPSACPFAFLVKADLIASSGRICQQAGTT
jgi:hypothetical protein